MDGLTRTDARRQKAGGASALYLALAYLAAMPYFLLVVDAQSATTAEAKVALVVGNYASMYAMYLVTYVFFGFALGALALTLFDRLRAEAPSTARFATAIGLLWSFVLVASGMVYTYGMTTIVGLAKTDPAQARLVWSAIEPIAQGLGGAGGEVLGGSWVLLVSAVALRTRALPRALGWFGAVVGAVGLVSVAPPLFAAAYGFGLLQIVWFVWLGVILLTTKATAAEQRTVVREAAASPQATGTWLEGGAQA